MTGCFFSLHYCRWFGVFLLEGANVECTRAPRKSSVIFAGSLVLPKSVLVKPVVLYAECPLFPQFSVNSCLCAKSVKDLACAPGAGFANVRLLSLASLVLCSKRQQKATPQGWNFGLDVSRQSFDATPNSPSACAHTHTHNTQFWKACN